MMCHDFEPINIPQVKFEKMSVVRPAEGANTSYSRLTDVRTPPCDSVYQTKKKSTLQKLHEEYFFFLTSQLQQ